MERKENIIGLDEISKIHTKLGILDPCDYINLIPKIPEYLLKLSKDRSEFIIILGFPFFKDGSSLTISKFKSHLGTNPESSEPCFYNQDWYNGEKFYEKSSFNVCWYAINNNLLNTTRGISPSFFPNYVTKNLPSAILCVYTFFVYYYTYSEFLWKSDYVWCSDEDKNSDQIYIGGYVDPFGINRNGLEIHRHLSIKSNYGASLIYF